MANERDNAFTSTGIGGMDQGIDFESGSTVTNRSMDGETGHGEPVTARAREAVSTAGHKAVERVQESLTAQVSRATGQLESVASSLRQAGEQMPDNGLGRYMVQAATQVDNLASFLGNREIGELVDEVETFARRQPAVFIGGAFALGVLGARFLRSSRQNMGIDSGDGYRRSYSEDGDQGMRSGGTTSYGRTGDMSQSTYGSGYTAGAAQSGSGYTSSTPGGTTGTNLGLGGTAGLGSTSTSRDLASDMPSTTRDFGTSTGGMTGSGTSRSSGFGTGGSTSGGASSGSLAGDDDTGTTGFRGDSYSASPRTESDREHPDSETDMRSPDFL